jgi:hypothetical protein
MAVNQCIQPMREDDGLATDCRYPIFLNQKLKISKQETASQVVDEANLTNLKLNRSFTEQVDAHQKQHHVEDSIDYSPMSPKPMRRYQRRNSKTAAMLSPSVASIQQQSALPSTLFLLSKEHVSPFNSDLPMDKGSNEAVPSTSRKKRRNSDTCESTGRPEEIKMTVHAYAEGESPKRLREAQSPIRTSELTVKVSNINL